MSLTGKTIARDDGDTFYFTDGTSLCVTSDDGHWIRERDWAETQAALHADQGRRERDRIRRLHDSLHPRDKQWLAAQKREMRERELDRRQAEWEADRAAGRPTSLFGSPRQAAAMEAAIMADFNRSASFLRSIDLLPPLKKKHRPFTAVQYPRTVQTKDGGLRYEHGTITIPVQRVRKARRS